MKSKGKKYFKRLQNQLNVGKTYISLPYRRWGWATSHHNISYSLLPTISNAERHGNKRPSTITNCGTIKISTV